ncbi:MAG: recombination mediator RecR [Nannocystaceae bacterium]|nr:recombination mediator RecR [bacterium]
MPADPLQRLSALLGRLPGIGDKTALRLALAIVKSDPEYVRALSEALGTVHNTLQLCTQCCDLTPEPVCERCSDAKRDGSVICVVAQPQDRMAIERSGVFRGLYHVLHGVLDPLGGIGPSDLKIEPLLRRLEASGETQVEELIVATSPNVEGDATALYLSKLIGPLGVKVSRIASGVAVGGELEYADVTTLHRALEDRRRL